MPVVEGAGAAILVLGGAAVLAIYARGALARSAEAYSELYDDDQAAVSESRDSEHVSDG